MIETPLRVLLIEDDQDDYLLVRDYLGGTDDTTPRLEWAATYEAGRAALARREHDIALIDYQLGAHSGLDLLRAADGTSDLPPTILLTATSDAAIDAAAQTAGAFDSLIKGQLNALTLERSIRYTLDQSRQRVALAKSQQFLQATLDTLSAHIAVLDERGVIIAVNAAWRRFGAENASSDARYGVGLDYLAVCDAGAEDPDAAAVAAGIRALLAGHEEPFEREYPCHGPTERRWFAVRATRFAADGPARVIVAHENVSACKVAEERTRTQTQLLDQVEAAVIATDPAGIVTYWNAHATTLYGWTPAEALGQPIHDLTVGPADPAVTAAIWTQLRAGQSWAGEFMARNQSGTTFPAHGTDAPFQDADGHLAGIVGVSVDISERKRADDALRASERDFRGLLEQAADAIFIFAPDGHFLTVNARACALTGYERAELLACAVADIMPPEEADAISARVAELAAGPRTRERLVRRKDGTLIPSEVSAALLDDGRVQIIIRDNTARKAAEQALIVSEGRYRLLMEQASDGIVVMDTAGQFLEASAQMCAMLGYTHEELLRLSSSAVIAPADLAGRPLVVPAPGAERVVFERLVRRKDGTTLPVEASVKRLPDGRVQSIVRDITERQAAAVALHAQHTFTAAIADSLGEGVYAVDTAGRLTFLNPAAERLLGWSQAELLGQDMHATIHSHHEDGSPFPQEDCPLLGVLHTGIPYRAEEDHFVRRDGTTFPVTYTSAPICSADEVTGAVLAFQDITARKVAEAELREREEQFRYLFARNPHPMWVYDSVTLAFLEVNEAAITHYGYTRDEFLAMTLVDIRPLDQIEQLRALCPGARADGSVPGTWQHRTKDGRTIAVEIAVRALEYGGRLARLAVVQDVTARAAVEDALRASEARFRALVQQLGDVIAIADAQGIMRYASPAIEATLGYTPAAFVGISRYSYVHPDDHAAVGATFARALAEPGVPVAVTYRAHHRDGSWRWIESSATSRLDDPAVAGVVINARDITARVEADEALRQGAESFASLFEATGDGIIIIEEGRIVAINRAYTALMGYEPDDLIGRPVLDIVAPDERTRIAARIAANDDEPYEILQLRKDGSVFLAEVVGRSIRYHGRPARLSTVRDITARKRTADALHADAARRQALIEMQHAVAAAQLDPATLMQIVIGHAQSLTNADGAMLELLEGEELVCRAAIGGAAGYVGLRLPVQGTLSGRCVQTGEAQRCDDAEQAERADRSAWAQAQVRSILLVSLRYDGRTFGVLKVLTRCPAAFTANDLETLELLAGVGGAALSHAAAYEEQRALAAALRTNEISLAEAQRVAHLGSWEYDYATRELHWSDEVFRIGGFVPQSFVPTPGLLESLTHPDDRERVAQAQRAAHAGSAPYDLDHRIVRTDGAIRIVHQQAERICDETGRPLKRMGIVQDVTERRALEEQLQYQAFHDSLTGLPNRALLFDRIGQALSRARHDERPCAVLFLDLDRFKDVNDTAGHDAGDRLLVAVAARLRGAVRDGDTLARLGGDEFTILLEDMEGPNEAVHAATRLIEALVAPFFIAGQEYRLTVSIGIALGRPDHQRPEDVLRDADIAMYRAKEGGRAGYAIFDPAMQAQIVARLELERDLHHALDQQEFELYYQPIVDLRSGEMAKVEALLRWQHPSRGLVSPGDFIPLAEETGLIRPLGRWVLREACRQARAWQMAGTPMAIAVNLTALEFQQPDLVEQVAAALAEAGTEARWLRLEITESLAMRDVATTIDTLRSLRAMGVVIAIDDFGTGYSSLAYLKRLPVSVLKIDKAFIDGVGTDEEETAIVAAIITLGHTLGLRVIAEGVETAAQARLLRALGCDQAQGYHFARPLPAATLASRLEREAAHGNTAAPPKPITGGLQQCHLPSFRQLLPDSGGAGTPRLVPVSKK